MHREFPNLIVQFPRFKRTIVLMMIQQVSIYCMSNHHTDETRLINSAVAVVVLAVAGDLFVAGVDFRVVVVAI